MRAVTRFAGFMALVYAWAAAAAAPAAAAKPDMARGQQLATTWYGPEASNRAYLNTHRVMAKYVDLLKAS